MVFARIDDGDLDYPNGYWWLMIGHGGNENLTKSELINGENYRYENRFGGGFTYAFDRDDKKILEICEADSWSDLDWETVLLRPESKYGYIDPEGNWYGCSYHAHADLRKYVLKQENPEDHGWVHVYREFDGKTTYYTKRNFLSEPQIKILLDMGIEVCPWDYPE